MNGSLKNTLMVVPARGGSKRLPGKNLLPLAGKPLIAWTIDAALESGIDARVMVTSEDRQILSVAKGYESRGLIVHRREKSLATDSASTADVLVDAICAQSSAGWNPETVILLQPTSPLRSATDIVAALEMFNSNECTQSVVGVCEVDHPSRWTGTIDEQSVLRGIDFTVGRLQCEEKEYRLNGALYIFSAAMLIETHSIFSDSVCAFVMPRHRSVDIDHEIDLRLCEAILKTGGCSR